MENPEITTSTISTDDTTSILLLSKICSMFILGFGSLILGMLPLIIGKCRVKKIENRRTNVSCASTTLTSTTTLTDDPHADSSQQGLLTSLLLCFGGGVLLFTTFLHLAPEVRESVELHQSNGQLPNLGSLSLAELLFCAGFFFVYLVEETVHAALTNHPDSSETLLYRTVSVRRCNGSATINGTTHSNNNNQQNHHQNNHRNHNHNNLNHQNNRNSLGSANLWRDGSGDEERVPSGKSGSTIFVLSPTPVDLENHSQKTKIEKTITNSSNSVENSMRSLLTVIALSFHAIFEGLAVGLEPAFSSVCYLAAAIATHKLVISFCVGMELYVAGASKKSILGYLSVFSMVTPLGIGVGIALGHMRSDSETLGPTPTILQGMAAGTLLYVVFFEVLARERANNKSGLLQLAAIMVGFMLMLGLQIATAHTHDHGHSHGHDHDHEVPTSIENDTVINEKNSYVLDEAVKQVTEKVISTLSNAMT